MTTEQPFLQVASFYRFAPLPRYAEFRRPLQALCEEQGLRGTVLLAPEGINGTVSGLPDQVSAVLWGIRTMTGLDDLTAKRSWAAAQPFLRMRVRLKAEIVTMGVPGIVPHERTGTEVAPRDWNALIKAPDVTVIDTRNGFEVAVGSFPGAIDPQTRSFGDFPDFVRHTLDPRRHKTIAMFCTGGIRCEKASSFLLQQGFEAVYQLKGGILSYLEQVPAHESLWEGACFVFDQRIGLGHDLVKSDLSACFGCRHPLTASDRASADFEDGVSCAHCAQHLTATQRASARERHRQMQIAERRGVDHLGTAAQRGPSPSALSPRTEGKRHQGTCGAR